MEKIFLTLLSTENYLKGVSVLNQSLLNTKTKYPFVVFLSERISPKIEKILNSNNIKTLRIAYSLAFDIPNINESGPNKRITS